MKLIAIATIVQETETIGIRLLDIDSLDTRDTSIQNIKAVIGSGRVSITNIELVDGELHGTNGSIDRLCKLDINKNAMGRRPIVVINEVDDGSYVVSSHTGRVRHLSSERVIDIAQAEGIANGKIVNKGGREILSSIKGEYEVIGLGSIAKVTHPKKLYTGEIVEGKRGLYPFAFTSGYHEEYMEIQNPTRLYSSTTVSLKPYYKEDIKKGVVHEIQGVSLTNAVRRKLRLSIKKDLEIIRHALNNGEIRKTIWDVLDNPSRRAIDKLGATLDFDLGVYVTNRRENYACRLYKTIMIPDRLDSDIEADSIISEDEALSIIAKLRAIKAVIVWHITLPFNGVAATRYCSNKGIDYRVIDKNTVNKTVSLEEIYDNPGMVQNAVARDGYIFIASTDGLYKYDMDKVAKEYRRMLLEDKSSVKAKLLGLNHEVKVTESGELVRLKCIRNTIIPENVLYIPASSIDASECEYLYIGRNVIRINNHCFSSYTKIKKIEIDNTNNIDLYGIARSLSGQLEIDIINSSFSDRYLARIVAECNGVTIKIKGEPFMVDTKVSIETLKGLISSYRFEGFTWLNRKPRFSTSNKRIRFKHNRHFSGDTIEHFNNSCKALGLISNEEARQKINQINTDINELYKKRVNEGREELARIIKDTGYVSSVWCFN